MALIPTAAAEGFSFADPYAIGLIVAGVAVIAAIGALSHEGERAFSASLIYLALGAGCAGLIEALGVSWIDPIKDASLVEKLSELAVIIALFGTGLKLDRQLRLPEWSGVIRLLVVAMPLTIGAVALFGTEVMGLSLGAAVILGAVMAPTDPVLAGDIGVGPPGDEDEREPNFSLTGEAGLNDGLAYPFLFLGVFIAAQGGSGWVAEWALADVLYAIVIAVLVGFAVGRGLSQLAVALRERDLLAPTFDGWLAVPAVLLIYGLTEVAGAYGFVAAFVGGVAFRRYEHDHEYNRAVHEGAEVVEKVGELTLVLLLGSMLTLDGISAPGLSGWLLVPVLILLIRPAAVGVALLRSGIPPRERVFIGWFGVRGIGSAYYLAVAAGAGALSSAETDVLAWTAIACIVTSIVVHGVTASPLSRRLLDEERG